MLGTVDASKARTDEQYRERARVKNARGFALAILAFSIGSTLIVIGDPTLWWAPVSFLVILTGLCAMIAHETPIEAASGMARLFGRGIRSLFSAIP